MAKKQKTFKIVEVEWVDPSTTSRWTSLKDVLEDCTYRCKTVGHMVHSDRKKICIALNWGEDGQISDIITIPKGVVHKITLLKKV